MFRGQISEKIISTISMVCQFTTKSGGIWKSLILGKAHRGFSAFLGRTHVATELMAQRRTTQGKGQAKRVSTLLRQGHHLVVLRQWMARPVERRER
jgi:hypothetical protein